MRTVYVAIESPHYERSTVIGVADSVEGAKKIADAEITENREKFGPWEARDYGDAVAEYYRSGPYSDFYVEPHALKEG